MLRLVSLQHSERNRDQMGVVSLSPLTKALCPRMSPNRLNMMNVMPNRQSRLKTSRASKHCSQWWLKEGAATRIYFNLVSCAFFCPLLFWQVPVSIPVSCSYRVHLKESTRIIFRCKKNARYRRSWKVQPNSKVLNFVSFVLLTSNLPTAKNTVRHFDLFQPPQEISQNYFSELQKQVPRMK